MTQPHLTRTSPLLALLYVFPGHILYFLIFPITFNPKHTELSEQDSQGGRKLAICGPGSLTLFSLCLLQAGADVRIISLGGASPLMPAGQYEMLLYSIGDLTIPFASWEAPDVKIGTCSLVFTGGIAPLVPSSNCPFHVTGSGAALGLGVSIKIVDKTRRGVIGFANSGRVPNAASTSRSVSTATCHFEPTPDSPFPSISGIAVIATTTGGGVKVAANISGIPNTQQWPRGFHIHQFGHLIPYDNSLTSDSAGPHYNPASNNHGLPGGSTEVHIGDLGNLAYFDLYGNGLYREPFIARASISAGMDPSSPFVLGRTMILHSSMDDGCTQSPPGNAGKKIAWCVIGASIVPNYYEAIADKIPMKIPVQHGSYGCQLANTPEKASSKTFIAVSVIISIALVAMAALFGYNWWRSRNNQAGGTDNPTGRQPWYARQENEGDEDDGPTGTL